MSSSYILSHTNMIKAPLVQPQTAFLNSERTQLPRKAWSSDKSNCQGHQKGTASMAGRNEAEENWSPKPELFSVLWGGNWKANLWLWYWCISDCALGAKWVLSVARQSLKTRISHHLAILPFFFTHLLRMQNMSLQWMVGIQWTCSRDSWYYSSTWVRENTFPPSPGHYPPQYSPADHLLYSRCKSTLGSCSS